MSDSVCIIIRKAPYGKIHATEAVRHINGALANGLETSVVLTGDGVYLARGNQEAGSAGWTSLSAALSQILVGKTGEKAKFYVHQDSLRERRLDPRDLMKGFEVVPGKTMAELVAGCEKALLF